MTIETISAEKLDRILQAVAERAKVPVDAIRGRERKQEVHDARMMYGWLAYRTRAGTLETISSHIGRKHTAVIYWRDKIEEKRGLNKQVRAVTDELRKELTQ